MPSLKCPICHCTTPYAALDDIPYRPFCSRRCKLIDLARWLNEEYRITEDLPPTEAGRDDPPSDPRNPQVRE